MHVVPHVPQFVAFGWVLDVRLTHAVPHKESPGPVQLHLLALHSVPEGHTTPQEPQFLLSLVTSLQAPVHRVWPVGHWHWPAWQVSLPEQVTPHEPQFVASDCGLVVRLTHAVPHKESPAPVHLHWPPPH